MVIHERTLLARIECGPGAFVQQAAVESGFKHVLSTEKEEREELEVLAWPFGVGVRLEAYDGEEKTSMLDHG